MSYRPVPIPIHGGVDTRTDPKLVRPPFWRDLRNAVFSQTGNLEKRPGSLALGDEDVAGNVIGPSRALATRKDELLRFTDQKVYSYEEAADKWIDKGLLESIVPTQKTVAFCLARQRFGDGCLLDGVSVYAWEDSRGGIRYSIYDEETGAAIYADKELSATGVRPRLIPIAGAIQIYWAEGLNLRRKTIRPFDVEGSFAEAIVTVATDMHSTVPVFDIVATSTTGVIAYRTNGAQLYVSSLSTSGGLVGTPTPITIAEDPVGGITVAPSEANDRLYIGWCTSGAVRYRMVTLSAFSGVSAAADHQATAGLRITASWAGAVCCAFWEISAAATYNYRVVKEEVSVAGARSGTATIRHSAIASGAFTEGATAYVVLVHDSLLQPTYFVARHDLEVVGRLLQEEAEGIRAAPHLARPQMVGRVAYFVATYREKLEVESNFAAAVAAGSTPKVAYADTGLKRIALDYGSNQSHRAVEIGKCLYLSGAQMWSYDGGPRPVEVGFHLYPENVPAPSVAAGGLPNGTYTWIFLYGWTNDEGEREFSSTALKITYTVAGSNGTVTWTVPSLAHTAKKAPLRTNVALYVFRTKVNPPPGAPAYLCSSNDPAATGTNGFVYNDPTADTVSFTDAMADAALAVRELCYLNTAGFDNLPPRVGTILAAGKDRVFAAGLERGNVIEASKLVEGSEVPAFNGDIEIVVDSAGGDITALEVLDDRLVIFKRDRIFLLVGDGPANTGGAWQNRPQLIPTDVGCVDQRTVTRTPLGVAFFSEKGWRLIDRNGRVTYIGEKVEAYNGQSFSAAVLLAARGEIRCLVEDDGGRSLLYDYQAGAWCTWTGVAAVDAVEWRGAMTYLRADGSILREDEAAAADAGTEYAFYGELAWIQPAGPLGWQAVKRVAAFGDSFGPHKVEVSVGYDFEEAWLYPATFDPTGTVNQSSWGSGASWGVEPVFGGAGSSIELWSYYLPRMKCASFTLRIEEIPDATPSRAFSLSMLVAELMVLPGMYPLRRAVRIAPASGGGGGAPGGGPQGG